MPPVGFEPTISTGERPQSYALDRPATGTGYIRKLHSQMCAFIFFYMNAARPVRLSLLGLMILTMCGDNDGSWGSCWDSFWSASHYPPPQPNLNILLYALFSEHVQFLMLSVPTYLSLTVSFWCLTLLVLFCLCVPGLWATFVSLLQLLVTSLVWHKHNIWLRIAKLYTDNSRSINKSYSRNKSKKLSPNCRPEVRLLK